MYHWRTRVNRGMRFVGSDVLLEGLIRSSSHTSATHGQKIVGRLRWASPEGHTAVLFVLRLRVGRYAESVGLASTFRYNPRAFGHSDVHLTRGSRLDDQRVEPDHERRGVREVGTVRGED